MDHRKYCICDGGLCRSIIFKMELVASLLEKKTESIWGVQVAELHEVGGATELDGIETPHVLLVATVQWFPISCTCLNSLDHNCICKYFLQLSSNNYWRL